MVRFHGGALGFRGAGGRAAVRGEREESSHHVRPMDDDGLSCIFRRGRGVLAEESSGAPHTAVGVVSREGMWNEVFEGLSDLAIDMGLEREAVEPAATDVV